MSVWRRRRGISLGSSVDEGTVIIKNPYTKDGNWYVGQLHFHTNASDGTGTPAQMKAAYAAAGYDFVVTTDHLDASHAGHTADPGGDGPLWILGSEITLATGHGNSIGEDAAIVWGDLSTLQSGINLCRDGTRNGIYQVNHPNTYALWDWWTELQPAYDISLAEVINAPNLPGSDWSGGIDLADEFRQVWWTGGDDAHNATTQVNKYCVVVQTASASIAEADILSSLDSGNFYIRQTAAGPEITGVSVRGNTITLILADIVGTYTVTWYKKGKRTAQTTSGINTTDSYTVIGTEGYVFAEIYDGTNYAYTQPFFILNITDLSSSASSSGGTAANLIDNSQATTCDLGDATGSFVIDVGAAKQINGIRIYWDDSGATRFNYYIEESSTGAFGGEQTQIQRTSWSNRAATTIDVFDVWSRYIKVTVTGRSVGDSGNAIIKEVEVFDSSPEISEYYINNVTGNNSNTGFATDTAWATIAYSLPKIRPRDRLNFVNSGTAYTQIGTTAVGNYTLGKHPGAKWRLRGINFPVVTQNTDSGGIYIAGQYQKYIVIEGFAATGNKYGVYLYGSLAGVSNIEIIGNKSYSNAFDGIRIFQVCDQITLAYNLAYLNTQAGINDLANANANIYMYNNTAFGNGTQGIVACGIAATICTVKNNISSGNTAQELAKLTAGGTLTDSNNCVNGTYYGTWAKTNNVEADPQFVDTDGADFSLLDSSPCIDQGVDLGYTEDILGNQVPNGESPDMGAYEY